MTARTTFTVVDQPGDGAAEHPEGGEERGSGMSGGHVRAEAHGEALPPSHGALAGDGPQRQASLSSGKDKQAKGLYIYMCMCTRSACKKECLQVPIF